MQYDALAYKWCQRALFLPEEFEFLNHMFAMNITEFGVQRVLYSTVYNCFLEFAPFYLWKPVHGRIKLWKSH